MEPSLRMIVAFVACIVVASFCPKSAAEEPLNNQGSALVIVDDAEVKDDTEYQEGVSFVDPNADEFIPTDEWQSVKEGQAVPRGLHIRLNMKTGEREAKLLEEDSHRLGAEKQDMSGDSGRLRRMKENIEAAIRETETTKHGKPDVDTYKYWKQEGKEGMVHSKKDHFSRDELKDALKNFKATSDDMKDPKLRAERVKSKFRNIDELKKDFKDLNLTMKTDLEIITKILEEYKDKTITTETRLSILSELEDYLHQIDNAENFAQMGGLALVIQDLNNTNNRIRSEAALVLGASMQSNPKVQVIAVDNGAPQQLIRVLSTETDVDVRGRILYALSSLLRHFPWAQQQWVSLGGVDALRQLFTDRAPTGREKLQLRAVTLLTDLLLEQVTAEYDAQEGTTQQKQKYEQYKTVKLLAAITERGWCHLLPPLLSLPDHDSREKVLNAMSTLSPHCTTSFQQARPSLQRLQREYLHLASEEEQEDATDNYFKGLLTTLENVLSGIDIIKKEL